MEPADLWETYIDPKYRDRAIRVVEVDGVEHLLMDYDELLMPPGVLAALGGAATEPRSRLFDGTMKYHDGCPPASYDPAARVALLDEWGVDVGVLFPTLGILWTTEDVGLASAYCRAYNDWQADFSAGISDRVAPIAQLNLLDVNEAEKELDRCLAMGFRGVFAYPEPVGGRRPGDPDFDPIWARCIEAGVPVCLHLVVRMGDRNPNGPWYGAKLEDITRSAEVNAGSMLFNTALTGPSQLMPAVTSMVTDGVFDRLPELKVVCVESGAGWAAYLMDRLDEKHALLGWRKELTLRPSEYLRRNVWFVAEPEERTIANQLDWSAVTIFSGVPTSRTSIRRWRRPISSGTPSRISRRRSCWRARGQRNGTLRTVGLPPSAGGLKESSY